MKLANYFKNNTKGLILVTTMVFIGCGLTAYGNYILTPMANSVKNNNIIQFLFYLSIMLLSVMASYILRYTAEYIYTTCEQKYIHTIRKRIVTKYFNNFHNEKNVAEMQNSLTNDLNILTETYLDPIFKILTFILDIVFSVSVVLTFNVYLLILIIFLAICLLYLPKVVSKPLQNLTNNVSLKNKDYINLIQKWMNGLAILQRYQCSHKLFNVLSKGASGLENAKVKKEAMSTKINVLSASSNMIAQALVLLLTGILIINHKMSFGVFFSIGNFASLIFSELVVLNQNITLIQSAKKLNTKVSNEIRKNIEVMNKEDDNINDFSTLNITNLEKKFPNGESITYPNMCIKKGEKILLSGDSGTGKSTLFKLILQELKPTKGKIEFKTKNGISLTPNLCQVGYIPQTPILFPGTIEDNITMFNKKLNKDAEKWATKMQLTNDLNKFPKGIETYIDLDKDNLSGGQKQKVVLARTKVYHSSLILVDEGTSAIDEGATLEILKNLLDGPETIIFIAHNWSKSLHDKFDREITL